MIGALENMVSEEVGLHVRNVENLQIKLSPRNRTIFYVQALRTLKAME